MAKKSNHIHHGLKSPSGKIESKRYFSSDDTAKIFDRLAKKIQKDRSAQQHNARDFDFLRDEVANRLTDRLEDIMSRKFPVALDLGSGSGLLAKYLQESGSDVKTLYQMDSSEKLLLRDAEYDNEQFPNVKPIRIVGDEEFIPFAPKSLDMIISNLSLHWVNDLPGTLIQICNCLKPDGLFLAAMFGEGSLKELRNSFTLAEQERDGGISPHISPFAGVADMGNLLTKAGFALTTVDTEPITINFADPFILMRDLQGMAENNAVINRRPFISKDVFMAAASIYQNLYGNEDGSVPATFNIVYMIGWSPDPSQQQPKKRGSATVSMKTLGKGSKLA